MRSLHRSAIGEKAGPPLAIERIMHWLLTAVR